MLELDNTLVALYYHAYTRQVIAPIAALGPLFNRANEQNV